MGAEEAMLSGYAFWLSGFIPVDSQGGDVQESPEYINPAQPQVIVQRLASRGM